MSVQTERPTATGRVSMSELLDVVDELAARRPVAARLVAMTDDDSVGSRELSATLMADVTLTARVMRLANSAFYGLGGRVRTVTFAVTVVGFSTIRAMAAVAAAGIDSDDTLPEGFWPRSKATALAASALAPLFAVPAPDAFCLGLLAGLGQAIMAQRDREAYQAIFHDEQVRAGGRDALLAAEVAAYGFRHTEVSAAALSAWNFPHDLAEALHHLDSPTGGGTRWSLCLASAVEAATRLVAPHEPVRDVLALSREAVTEERLAALLPRVQEELTGADW